MKLLRYLFYKIYSFSLSNGENDPGWASAIVSLFLIANFYSLLDFLVIFNVYKLPPLTFILPICGLILYLNYFWFIKKEKSKIIVKEFTEVGVKKFQLNIFLISYILGSVFLFIYTGNIVRAMGLK
jgi:hypothetical protein